MEENTISHGDRGDDGEKVSWCDKEVSEIKYQKDLFILQQGEGEKRALGIV